MARAIVKSRKAEGSIIIRIPKQVVEHERIQEGELLEIEARKAKKKDWFGAFKGIGPFTRKDELDSHELK